MQSCAEARVAHICRSTGRQESEHLLGTIVGQYRRLISTCAVRAQAMCLLARVGLITPAARDAARRRQVAMRLEGQMREERRAQWMASLQGPGWARRGRCHGLWSKISCRIRDMQIQQSVLVLSVAYFLFVIRNSLSVVIYLRCHFLFGAFLL